MEVVRGADLSGDDLTGYTAESTTFTRADLSEATSGGGTVFVDCVFRDSRFNCAEFTGAAVLNCTFTGCNFFAARFGECKFTGSRFERCEFAQLTVEGGDWSLVALAGADLRSASFRDVRMPEADLTGARCDGAMLRDCDLSRAMSGRASFVGADLRGSDLSALDPWTCELKRAVIDWRQAATIAVNLGLDVRADE